MQPKVTLLARCKRGSRYEFRQVEFRRGKPIAPDGASSFYLRYTLDHKRKTKPVGKQLDAAVVTFQNLELRLTRVRAGLLPLSETTPASGLRLRDAVEEHLETSGTIGNANDTLAAKRRTLESFCDVCEKIGVTTVDQVRENATGRRAVLAYVAWMKKQLPTVKVESVRAENTHYSRLRRLGTFLKQQGIKIKKDRNAGPADPGLLAHHEFPKYTPKQPTKYSRETVAAILRSATVDEADLVWFFLATGFRDGEVAHAEWPDINFQDGTINIHAKPQTSTRRWSWKPKDDESRSVDIPLSADFLKRMAARRERQKSQNCALIFPNSACRPSHKLLRIVRAAAKRAGITERIELHKFRKTFACYIAENHSIELVRKLLGHSDIATTQLYLSANEADVRRMKANIEDITAHFGA